MKIAEIGWNLPKYPDALERGFKNLNEEQLQELERWNFFENRCREIVHALKQQAMQLRSA